MKLYQTSDSSVLRLYFPFMGVLVLLCFTSFVQFATMHLVHWVFLLMLTLLFVSPARTQRFGERSYSWWQMLLAITGTSILLLMFFYLSSIFFSQLLPVNVPSGTTALTSVFLLTQGGLCPWAIVTLLAITLQKICLQDNLAGLISSCLQRFFNTDEHQDVGKFINLYFRHLILFALIMPMIVCWFAILHLIMVSFDVHVPLGINFISFAVTTYLFWIMGYSRWARGLNWLLDHHVPKLLGIMLMMLSLVAVLSAGSILAAIVFNKLQMPLIDYHFFSSAAWPYLWQSYNTFLAFSWVPITSAVIAIVSRGFAIWQIILATMTAPILSVLLPTSQANAILIHYVGLTDVLLIVVAMALLLIIFREKYLTHLLRATLPFPHTIKQRSTAMYARSIMISGVTMMCIYWVLGIYGVNFILTIATTPAMILMMLSILVNFTRLLDTQKK